jgi:hypothetical protein
MISYCFLVILPELGKNNSGSGIQNSAPAWEKPPEPQQNSGAQHYLIRSSSAEWIRYDKGISSDAGVTGLVT